MRTVLATLAVLAFATIASAQDVCPCIPKTPLWTVSACDSWDCAQSALSDGKGSPYVVAMPTASRFHRWIVLRRIISGTSTMPEGPFAIQSFDKLADASAVYAATDPELLPILTSTIDGKFVLIILREPEVAPLTPRTPVEPTTP